MNKFQGFLNSAKRFACETIEEIKENRRSTVVVVFVTFVLMVVLCLAVFFASVKGAEKVMVPNVKGKTLTTALLEMQEKELYPKIQLKYTDIPGTRGTVLEQNPKAGSIVKAYRRVTLTVSRGLMMESIEDYIGKNIDDVKSSLEIAFTGEEDVMKIANLVYRKDSSPKGTILAQYPKSGSEIEDNTKLQFVVSSGDDSVEVEIPEIENKTIKQVLSIMASSAVIFDFDVEESKEHPAGGKIVSQEKIKHNKAENYSRVNAVLGVRPRDEKAENVQGLFSATLPEYPFPVAVKIEAVDTDGKKSVLIDFNHPGEKLTVPYDVKKGTTLMLYVLGDEAYRVVVN